MLVPIIFALGLAQSQDLTLSLGVVKGGETKPGQYFGANYAHRLVKGEKYAVSGQVDFLASPNQKINRVNPAGSRDVASLYAMPGLRFSFQPEARWSPFVAGGLGLASFEQSALLQNGVAFPGSRVKNQIGGMYGGGVDLKVFRFAGLRFEAKDYIVDGHNFGVGIGLHFRWGGK